MKKLKIATLAALSFVALETVASAQFSVRTVNTTDAALRANGTENANTEAILADPNNGPGFTSTPDFINFFNVGDFPAGTTADNFALEATGLLVVPAAGTYFIGVNGDDGFRLTIDGATIGATVNELGAGEPNDKTDLEFDDPRGPAFTTGEFSFPSAGNYPIRMTFFELQGGEVVRLYQADNLGALGTDPANVRPLGDTSVANTLDVIPVPEPASVALLGLGATALLGFRRRKA